MNIGEGIKKLNKNGIYQLRKGESLADALDFINGNLPNRKGYKHKHDNGNSLSENEIKMESNKEAFSKSVKEPRYILHNLDEVEFEDISEANDFRDDISKEGEIQECQYCGTPVRTDEGAEFDILNCDACSSFAIYVNCM